MGELTFWDEDIDRVPETYHNLYGYLDDRFSSKNLPKAFMDNFDDRRH